MTKVLVIVAGAIGAFYGSLLAKAGARGAGGLPTLDILQTQELFVRSIMQEVCNIAAACGHRLPGEIVIINIDNTYAMPPYKTSMLLDYESGQPMETETILGNALRAAQRLGIAVPHLESVYALMKLRELRLNG